MNISKPSINISGTQEGFFSRSWHRHPFAIPVFTLFVLIVVTSLGFLLFGGTSVEPADKKVISLYIDGRKQTIPTRAESVRELLQRLNIQLNENDVVEPAVDAPITGNEFSVNVYRSRPVTVVDESGKTIVARIADRKPADIAKKAGLVVYPEDKVDVVPPDEAVDTGVIGEKIVVDRALPIKLSLYGALYDVRTQANTVADLAKERGIKYDNASVLPSPETKLKANDLVFITEPGKQIATVEEAIDQPTQYVDSVDVASGTTQVREAGAPGKKVVVYEVSPNGSKKALQEVVVLQPQRKLVARGAKKDPSKTFDGSFDAALARLRSCEGGYTSVNRAGGYYGAYQFDVRTWNNYGGYPNAAAAPPIVQDQKAWETYQRRGWQPWPTCSIKMGLQDSYR